MVTEKQIKEFCNSLELKYFNSGFKEIISFIREASLENLVKNKCKVSSIKKIKSDNNFPWLEDISIIDALKSLNIYYENGDRGKLKAIKFIFNIIPKWKYDKLKRSKAFFENLKCAYEQIKSEDD